MAEIKEKKEIKEIKEIKYEKIGILAWGSLIWKPPEGEYAITQSRLSLPIQFSRISITGKTTLVIDLKNGVLNNLHIIEPTNYMPPEELVRRLQVRERTIPKYIHFIDLQKSDYSLNIPEPIKNRIKVWMKHYGYDFVCWTGLYPNFQQKIDKPFTYINLFAYVNDHWECLEYIIRSILYAKVNIPQVNLFIISKFVYNFNFNSRATEPHTPFVKIPV
jgi:hypothetical protein